METIQIDVIAVIRWRSSMVFVAYNYTKAQ